MTVLGKVCGSTSGGAIGTDGVAKGVSGLPAAERDAGEFELTGLVILDVEVTEAAKLPAAEG